MDVTILFLSLLAFEVFRICKAETQQVVLCENGIQIIHCKTGYEIRIIDIKQKFVEGATCETQEKDNCTSRRFSQIRQQCDGQGICVIEGDSLKSSICHFQPRYIELEYLCYYSVEIGILVGFLVFLIVYIIRLLRNKIAIKIEVFPPSAEDNHSYVHTKVDRENDPVVIDNSSRTSKPSNQLHESSHLLFDSTETADNRNENSNQRLINGKSVFANQTTSQDQYLSSVKGVYDGTKDNRHVVKDVTNENCQITKNTTT